MSLILFGKKISGYWTRETLRELRIIENKSGSHREVFDQVHMIYHAKDGRFFDVSTWMDGPPRHDYPVEIFGVQENPSGFITIAAGTGAKRETALCAHIRYADGFEELASFTVTKPQEQALELIEAIPLVVEAEYLKQCRTAFPNCKHPPMDQFYIAYVIKRIGITEMERQGIGRRRTLHQYKRDLEGHMRNLGYHYTLDQLRDNPDLREAREKQADLRKYPRT